MKAFSVISVCECLNFADCLRVYNILQKRFQVETQLFAGLGLLSVYNWEQLTKRAILSYLVTRDIPT